MEYRIEHDSMGEMKVPANCYWGAQTQRSYQNFRIGTEKMPVEIIRAFAVLKRAAAMANCRLGKLDEKRCALIAQVCTEIIEGKLSGEFPLAVWQTGSGTQSNMNVNEVIANRGNAIAGAKLLHPNDTVNMSQSSNDTFPTAMHIAAVTALEHQLIPALDAMIVEMKRLEKENEGIVKSGRTHLQDAVPIAFSQEISGWRAMLEKCREMIRDSEKGLKELALGGTAVGTGLNAPEGFAKEAAAAVSELTGFDFITEDNKFHALSSKDAVVFSHGALKALAADMMKIANDVRWLASGPRCGIGCEAVTMVAVQVMGNDAAIGIAASQGNFQLNVFMPVIIYNYLQSVRLLSDALNSFRTNCVCGITANREKMSHNLHNSLMLVTALNPYIGYENAAKTAKLAYKENISLKEACVKLGFLTSEKFDEVFHPEQMV